MRELGHCEIRWGSINFYGLFIIKQDEDGMIVEIHFEGGLFPRLGVRALSEEMKHNFKPGESLYKSSRILIVKYREENMVMKIWRTVPISVESPKMIRFRCFRSSGGRYGGTYYTVYNLKTKEIIEKI